MPTTAPGATAWARSTVIEPGPHPQSSSRIPARRCGVRNVATWPVRRAKTARLHSASTRYGRSFRGVESDTCSASAFHRTEMIVVGTLPEPPPQQHDIWRLPPERSVERLGITPNVGDQDATTPSGQLSLGMLDKGFPNTTASRLRRDNEFAEVGPETTIVGTDEARDHRFFFPYERQVAGVPETLCQGLVGPIGLPESWLCFHQPSNG